MGRYLDFIVTANKMVELYLDCVSKGKTFTCRSWSVIEIASKELVNRREGGEFLTFPRIYS